MSKQQISFSVSDISHFAKSLRAQLLERETLPTHVELLNILAKSAGHMNFQSLRASATHALTELSTHVAPIVHNAPETALLEPVGSHQKRIQRIMRCFNEERILVRWPGRRADQIILLWVLWAHIPAGQVFHEKEINALLTAQHSFGDYALLRRDMCDLGLMWRTADGREYKRIEQSMPPEAEYLLQQLKQA